MELHTISANILSPAKPGDVGYNLICSEDATLNHGVPRYVGTGVKVKIPHGYWGIVTGRSSSVFKRQILVFPGVIDEGYTGELFVACIAMGDGLTVKKGESIAQLILFPAVVFPLLLVPTLPATERGENGFGSTGK